MNDKVNLMKKTISMMLLGSLLVTGAVVYADNLSETNPGRGLKGVMGIERSVKGTDMLSGLVTAGVITESEKAALEKAMETWRAEMTAQRKAAKAEGTRPERGEKPASHFAQMAEQGLISEALAAKIDAYMSQQRETAFAKSVQPLVDSKAFADADAVRKAMDAVREAMKAKMDTLKPDDREKVDFKSLTEAERAALKEKMEAQRTAMQEKHETAMAEVYSQLVSDGTLTQAQADALKDAMKGPMAGGRGRGPMGGFGKDAAAQ